MLVILGSAFAAIIIDYVVASGRVQSLIFFPETEIKAGSSPDWEALVRTLFLVLGLPTAFVLWNWRDLNVRDQLANQRKDTNLREFSDIQIRAAGALSKEVDLGARETLQIAALHQLRGYLRGEYGETFRRSTFELYSALLARPKRLDDYQINFSDDVFSLSPIVYENLRELIEEDWIYFFRSGYSLEGRSYRNLKLKRGIDLSGLSFARSDLSGSEMPGAVLDSCNFRQSNLNKIFALDATLQYAMCESATFVGATLNNATLTGIKLRNADCNDAKLQCANLRDAEFIRTNLTGAVLDDTSVCGAIFVDCELRKASFHYAAYDTSTQFWPGWHQFHQLSESLLAWRKVERDDARTWSAPYREIGMLLPHELASARLRRGRQVFGDWSNLTIGSPRRPFGQ